MKKAKEELEDTVESLERNHEVIFLFGNFLYENFSVCFYCSYMFNGLFIAAVCKCNQFQISKIVRLVYQQLYSCLIHDITCRHLMRVKLLMLRSLLLVTQRQQKAMRLKLYNLRQKVMRYKEVLSFSFLGLAEKDKSARGHETAGGHGDQQRTDGGQEREVGGSR